MHRYLASLFVLLPMNVGNADVRTFEELLADKRAEFDSVPGWCEPSGDPPPDPSIPAIRISEHEEKMLTDRFNSLEGEREVCANAYVQQYRTAVFDYCKATCLGAYVAGGCQHIVINSLHSGVLHRALQACR